MRTEVEVLYSPINVSTDPISTQYVRVHNQTVLVCSAVGNPPPTYSWIHQLYSGQIRRRGDTAELLIEDVGYGDQGEYSCVARNSIGGEGREIQSDSITIEVTGVPEVVTHVKEEEVGVTGRTVL